MLLNITKLDRPQVAALSIRTHVQNNTPGVEERHIKKLSKSIKV